MTDQQQNEKPSKTEEYLSDDRAYFSRLAHYSRGCPGLHMEDICEDPADCAANGFCRELRDRRLAVDGGLE